MNPPTRRTFLKQSSALVAGSAALGFPFSGSVLGANERIQIGVIGPGGMGMNLLKNFAVLKDVSITHVCDPDESHMRQAAQAVEEAGGKRPREAKDLRRVLEDKEVVAVIIATPDHWHAPAAILACDAGKHVYVEKPCCHNIREGRLMIEAARRSNRIIQTGTQSRSAEHVVRAMQLLREGAIGDVLVSKAWNSQLRTTIGKVKPSEPPAGFDYDLWVGPAPMVPFQSNRHHSWWRWWHSFGTGDMGNDGVHDIDLARWGLGVDRHPTRISALGGKYYFNDDQEFPDTQYVSFEYDNRNIPGGKQQLIFEQRIWSPYVQEGHENGNAFYGTKGMLILGKGKGWELYGPKNELREKMSSTGLGPSHHRNFLDCLRSGKLPNADVQVGHLSAALCHLGNIATRVGRQLKFNPQTEQIEGDAEANALVRRTYRENHWAVPEGV